MWVCFKLVPVGEHEHEMDNRLLSVEKSHKDVSKMIIEAGVKKPDEPVQRSKRIPPSSVDKKRKRADSRTSEKRTRKSKSTPAPEAVKKPTVANRRRSNGSGKYNLRGRANSTISESEESGSVSPVQQPPVESNSIEAHDDANKLLSIASILQDLS